MSTSWGKLNNILMNSLIMDFGTYGDNTSLGTVSHSLEMLCNNLQQCLARLGAEFQFGQHASVHAIMDCLLTSSGIVTASVLECQYGHDSDGDERSAMSCEIFMPGAPKGHTVQQHLDKFAVQLSRSCSECSSTLYQCFSLAQHPLIRLVRRN